MLIHEYFSKSACPACVQGQARRGGQKLGARLLLEWTDRSDFPICLANEMMTYGGNMNSFDEASFLMQSSGLGGGAGVSVRLPLPAVTLLFQRPLAFSPNCHAHVRKAGLPVLFGINLVDLLKHSCTWLI